MCVVQKISKRLLSYSFRANFCPSNKKGTAVAFILCLCNMSALLRYNICLDHAYEYGSPQYRHELELLLCFVRAALQTQFVQRVLIFEHHKAQAFDLFLSSPVPVNEAPSISSFLDAPSLLACEAVSRGWRGLLALAERPLWDNLCRAKFFVCAAHFQGSSGRGAKVGNAGKAGKAGMAEAADTGGGTVRVREGLDDEGVSPRLLYRQSHQKLRRLLSGAGGDVTLMFRGQRGGGLLSWS